MTEIEPLQPQELVNPSTGQMIDLRDVQSVAIHLDEIRQLEDRLKEAKRILGRVLAAEAERQGTQTLHLPGLKVPISKKREIHWDLEILKELRELGLPTERWSQVVRTTVDYKVMAGEAKKIAAANPAYAEVIKRARTDFDGELYVGKIERYFGHTRNEEG